MVQKLSIFVLGFLLWLPWAANSAPTPDSSKPDNRPLVFVQKAKNTELFDELTYPARVISRVDATLLAEADGVVTKIYLPLGTRVKQGQRVMRLNHTDPVYQYAPQYVVAPVTGVVSGIEVTVGTRVSKGHRLAIVTDPDDLCAKVEVAALDLNKVKSGLKGTLQIAGFPHRYPVQVLGVSPFVDSATGTASSEIQILSSRDQPSLRPGLVGQIRFKANVRQGIALPVNSLVYRQKGIFVRTVQKGKAHFTEVEVGNTQRGVVEILKGLHPDDSVIVRESGWVGEGTEVRVEVQKGTS